MIGKIDIEIHEKNPLGKYCVHEKSDVMWTDSLSDVFVFLAEKMKSFSEVEDYEPKSHILPDNYHTPGSDF
jgi:hypothetical protein